MLGLLAGLAGGCRPAGGYEVLLQIGAYRLTATDYASIRRSAPYRGLTDVQAAERLVEEGRILAYAMDHRFDTIGLLDRQLLHTLRYYASSVDGYVWNKEVKPLLSVSAGDIRAAYALRDNEYELETLYFPSERVLRQYHPVDQPVQTGHAFTLLREKTRTDTLVGSSSSWRRYPFFPFGIYLPGLAKAPVGSVCGPFETLSGYYVLYLARKRPAAARSLEAEQTSIRDELVHGLRQQYIWESQQQVLRATQPKLRDTAIAEMAARADVQERKWPGVNDGMVLMEYFSDGKRQQFTAAHFKEFIQCTPVFTGSLSNAGDVRNMLRSYLISTYLYAKGQQLGMEKDSAYQLLRKRCQQSIFLHHYKQQPVYPPAVLAAEYPIQVNHISEYQRKQAP